MAQTYLSPWGPRQPAERPRFVLWVDLLLFLAVAAVAYGIVALAARSTAPLAISVPIDLSWRSLPSYAGLSTLRMALAYVLSAGFSVAYARIAVLSRATERFMIPLLDILQSIPILSFMPGIVLGLVALFPDRNLGLELAAILLIFTSQAWNIAFGFHQSLVTIPRELSEAAVAFRLNFWQRFTRVELPFGMIPFIWNSMMSWAGGWFFLMAAEQFTLGDRDFRLPGLGSYLQASANAGNLGSLALGLGTLVLVIVVLDQFLWRPLVAWSDRFKMEQTGSVVVPQSSVLLALRRSAMLAWARSRVLTPIGRWADERLGQVGARPAPKRQPSFGGQAPGPSRLARTSIIGLFLAIGIAVGWGVIAAAGLLAQLNLSDWIDIGLGAGATLLRTAVTLLLGVAWTVPCGVAIGLNRQLAHRVQPIVQVVASIPATALFPALLLVLLRLPGGLNLAAVALMLLGTQWYILFNVIAGSMTIPTDLREASAIFKLGSWHRWRYLILPAIFPSLVTGLITASGGAWNASIVAEYVTFGGKTYSTVGLGALVAGAAASANFPLLLASTLTMAIVVVVINRLIWRRLSTLAAQRYRLD